MLGGPQLGFVVGSSEALAIFPCGRAPGNYSHVIDVSQGPFVWLRVTGFNEVGIVEQV